jgi:hypothetical protein
MRGFLVARLGAGVLLLSACGWEMSRNEFTDDAAIDAKITNVRVHNESGDVTIRTGDRASVHRTVRYDRDRPGATHHVEGDVLVIDRCPVRKCAVDYEVTVPAGTRVNGESDSGRVEVTGAAEVNFKVDSGDLTVSGVTGRVNVEADSGRVSLSDLGADVVVRADAGDVTVDNARGSVTVRGDSGNIAVSVPRGPYRVSTGTDSGTVHSDVSDDPSGSHRLELHTSAGNITVKYV